MVAKELKQVVVTDDGRIDYGPFIRAVGGVLDTADVVELLAQVVDLANEDWIDWRAPYGDLIRSVHSDLKKFGVIE